MSGEARIARLEQTVKHLILSKQDDDKFVDYFQKEQMSMEEFSKREQEHKTVFQKFLHWIAK